jgi:hypothetical protein
MALLPGGITWPSYAYGTGAVGVLRLDLARNKQELSVVTQNSGRKAGNTSAGACRHSAECRCCACTHQRGVLRLDLTRPFSAIQKGQNWASEASKLPAEPGCLTGALPAGAPALQAGAPAHQ